MPIAVTAFYWILTALSLSLNFIAPFTGIGILKALPTALLAVAAYRLTGKRFGFLIGIGVAFGSAGDFFLASMSKDWFLAGIVAFFIGHLFYLRAFWKDLAWTNGRVTSSVVSSLALAGLGIASAVRLQAAEETGLIVPVLLYTVLLGTFMVVSILHRSPSPWIAIGAVVFVISDGHIAVNHMLLDAPLLPITLTGYTNYYLAQYLIVLGATLETRRAGAVG